MPQLLFIRHGMTPGNEQRQYIGSTDEPLSQRGEALLQEMVRDGRYPTAQLVLVSPLLRCRQTAGLLFPDVPQQVVEDFRECCFGLFEGKNYEQLQHEPAYQRWLDNPDLPFPQGEARPEFIARCCHAFAQQMDLLSDFSGTVALVVHGGTIMAIMERYCSLGRGFYDYQLKNGQGYLCRLDGQQWNNSRSFDLVQTLA